ncbi:probable low-specificity L-threonine aldolase 2 [Agrilus planipennis]|uniref:Probable low-specificity L-threonine aldolase 2 n=1 Tax=Agrilus planipennis TaxID=224129 RepID=A0A1W4WFY4_AGRPL|nr:probable low-specificity L-threonine aldolase 2 [Agrilus planipennis]
MYLYINRCISTSYIVGQLVQKQLLTVKCNFNNRNFFILTLNHNYYKKMPYEVVNGFSNGIKGIHVVDLRSDTVSKPTKEMRDAMAIAEVGDDVFGEDPTVRLLEETSADLLGKEDALFVPSGTMANLLALLTHCSRRGTEVIVGEDSHVIMYEQAGAAQFAGVQLVTIKNESNGTFSLKELEAKIRINPDCHEPETALIVVENTHNMCGGKVLPLEWLEKVSKIAKTHNIRLHMDGARIFNAAVQSKVSPRVITKDIDSVCFCLSKGLGAPIGSVLCGTKSFIEQARRTRKALGGGMRQAGIVAAAGLVALDKMVNRLEKDHKNIYKLAKAIHDLKSDIVKVDLKSVQTNILIVHLNTNKLVARDFLVRLATVQKKDSVKVIVKAGSRNPQVVRFVSYWEIDENDMDAAIEKVVFVIKEFETRTKV